jgi:hypothetical protein
MTEDIGKLDETPQTAGDLREVKRIRVSEQQLDELIHAIADVIRGWLQERDMDPERPKLTVRARPAKPCAARRMQLPVDFILDAELMQYARDHLPEVNVMGLLEVFRLQAQAKHWLYADWRRAFQVYVRNASPMSGHWAQGQYPKLSHQIDWTLPVDLTQIKW